MFVKPIFVNQMKPKFIVVLSVIFLATSCTKDATPNSSVPAWQQALAALNTAGFNEEAFRVYNDLQEPDYIMGIITNSNYGRVSGWVIKDSPYFSGDFPENTTVTINGIHYELPNSGSYLLDTVNLSNSQLFQHFGSELNIVISIDGTEFPCVRQSPEVIKVEDLIGQNFGLISRSGELLKWNANSTLMNPLGKVAIAYRLYSGGDPYENGLKVVDDIGTFALDEIVDAVCEEVEVNVYRGNSFSFMYQGKKHLFLVYSVDYHNYGFLE
jgi:hypothetical protein